MVGARIVGCPEVGKLREELERVGRDGDSLGVLLVVGVVVDLRAAAGWLGFGGDMAVRGEVRKSGAEPGDQIGHTNGAGGMTADILGVPRTLGCHPCGGRYRDPSVNTIGEC
ncbi:Uncharacterised protein [Mycobacterium tuberculosis]|uniref:Uncharacterized protein n=1 Tax=Mycobacterium tuberculosis TaxID=1773 RepID=A0A0T9B0T5_MYCTX|nr:Uncharacterised protein [Mycobacterium tuberculosis]CKR33391.1 Uncharacterised protein [Mycobacterium tuberculosis]CKT42352.1 Uncharacterised protein [Mycobacterium tuberculosis]CKW39515.1 Uncharacterised protein [Mycobacterium tuberculosis]COW13234.1 Uncharacterised protein [Mycobacterium tuberculosis]